MANKKITQLPSNTNPTSAGVLPIVESGVTDQTTAQDLITKAHGLAAGSTVLVNSGGVITAVANGGVGEVLTADGSGGASYQPAAGGQILYDILVAPSGGDYTNLSAALAAATTGQTIFIKPGTYSESSVFIPSLNQINIIGSGVDNTILDFGPAQFFSLTGNDTSISNLSFIFDNGYFYLGGMSPVVNNVTVTANSASPLATLQMEFPCSNGIFNNLVYSNTPLGPNPNTRVVVTGSNNRFNDCTFNVDLDGLTSLAPAINTQNTDFSQFYNCVFTSTNGPSTGCNVLFHNNTEALVVDGCYFNNTSPSEDYAIYDNNAENSKITNSRFVGYGNAIYVSSGSGDTLVDNNQIISPTTSGIGIDVDYGFGVVVSNNKVTLGGGSSTGIRVWNGSESSVVIGNMTNGANTGVYIDTGVLNTTVSSNSSYNGATPLSNNDLTTNIVNGPKLYEQVVDQTGQGNFTGIDAAINAGNPDRTIFVRANTYVTAGQTITNTYSDITFIGDGRFNTSWVLASSSFTNNAANLTFRDMTIVLFDAFGASEFISNTSITFQNCNLVVVAPTSYFEFNISHSITNCAMVTEGSDGVNSQFRINSQGAITNSSFILGNDNTSDVANDVQISSSYNSMATTAVIINTNVFASLVDAPIKFTGNNNIITGCGWITATATPGATGAFLSVSGNDNVITSNIFDNTNLQETTGVYLSGTAARNKITSNIFNQNERAIYSVSEGYQNLLSENSCISAASTSGIFAYFDSGLNPNYNNVISNNIVEGTTSVGTSLLYLENSIGSVIEGNSLIGVDDGIILGAVSDTNLVYGNIIDCGTPITDNGVANNIGTTGSFTVGANTIDVAEGITTNII